MTEHHRFATRCCAAALLLAVMAPVAAKGVLEQLEPPAFHKARQALDGGRPGQALAVLEGQEHRLVQRRDLAELHGLRCRAHLALGAYAAAVEACLAAIDQREAVAAWRFHNNLGVAHLESGDYEQADLAFRNARALNARSTAPRRNLRVLAAIRDGATPDLEALAASAPGSH